MQESNPNSNQDTLAYLEDGFRDHLGNQTTTGGRLWIYPRIVKGFFHKYRSYVSWLLLGLLFALPFVEVNGHPLFLFNVLERKFIFWAVPFFPQDFHLVALGLITFIVFIILFTIVFGRVWCGWACPQTIFMEMLFRKLEILIEGDHNAQRRLDKQPWNFEKIWKKTLKHFVFFVISFCIANTFLAYIIGKKELFKIVQENPMQHISGLLAICIFTFVFYFVFARFRELVCIVVCPYGRLQGVLLDKKSMIVAYDYVRGEPRGHLQKQKVTTNITPKGDCIDCNLCVQVCPTGIDIRHGTQLECIGCTACIDACDHVMDMVNLPKGLIRYDSLEGIKTGKKFKLNMRIAAYSSVLVLLIGFLGFLLATRNVLETTILRAPGLQYQQNKQGIISNLYTVEIMNKSFDDHPVSFSVKNIKNATINMVNKDIIVPKGELAKSVFFIEIPKNSLPNKGSFKVEIEVKSDNEVIDHTKTSFVGPLE